MAAAPGVLAASCALVLTLAACGGVARSIDIPRLPGPEGRALVPAHLSGYVVRPEGSGPFGAVILLHGCSGLGLETTHKVSFNRNLEWAEWYRSRGYVALRYLAGLPFVRQDRVVIQGLSHGGSTVLRALDDVSVVRWLRSSNARACVRLSLRP